MKWILVLVFCLALSGTRAQETSISKDLEAGRYQKIIQSKKAEGTGEWAWARFFLLPDAQVYSAAKASHSNGDILGSFILLKCYRGGIGVKKDDAIKDQLNRFIRAKLEGLPNPNGIESYMLAYLLPENRQPQVNVEGGYVSRVTKVELVAGKERWQHLGESAQNGFAQAMDEIGLAMQQQDLKSAYGWYEKAGQLGLAASMKNLGFLYATNPNLKDPNKAKMWTERSANGGDVSAMINLAAFADKEVLDNISLEEGRKWIDKAAETGHPLGMLEKGTALITGRYGYPVDEAGGKLLIQKAAKAGDSTTLGQISYLYLMGAGVEKDLVTAAKFGEAAYIQGDVSAPQKLEYIYRTLMANDPSLQSRREYWAAVTRGAKPNALKIEETLQSIDPFNLEIK